MAQSSLPPVFFVNLKRHQARRQDLQRQLDRLAVPYHRIDAVDGEALSEQHLREIYSPDKAIRYIERQLSSGEIGCYLSHLKAMQAIADSDAEYGLILEDDIEISNDLVPVLVAIRNLEFSWQLIQIGHAGIGIPLFWREERMLAYGYEVGIPHQVLYGTQGYLVTKNFCCAFLEKSYPIFCPIDTRLFDIFLSLSFFHALKGKQLVRHKLAIPSAIQEHRNKRFRPAVESVASLQSAQKQQRVFLTTAMKVYKKRLFRILFFPILHRMRGLLFKYGFIRQDRYKPSSMALIPVSESARALKIVRFYFYLMWYLPWVEKLKKTLGKQ